MARAASPGRPAPAAYKVVEVSPVSDETLEDALNAWTREGWSFESLHFVTREGSHRPALAYLFFVRAAAGGEGAPEPRRGAREGG